MDPEPLATLVPADLPAGLEDLIAPYLARQRWYAGAEGIVPQVRTVESGQVIGWADSGAELWWAVVNAGGEDYQVVVGRRPSVEAAERLKGHEDAIIGALGLSIFFDATADSEMAVALLGAAGGGGDVQRARPLGAEQSNTSLVYDDRLVLKLFRRLAPGPNPDVEVTSALAAAGFAHIAQPMVRWRLGDRDLAFGQQYLAGGTDGWALALTSLRDFYGANSEGSPAHPALSGGDFAAEACRLGQVTGEMHLAMADAFEVSPRLAAEDWAALIGSIESRLQELTPELVGPAAPLLVRLRAVTGTGPALVVHGDYHLGQVMRTDAGWFVLDFEGEPHRHVDERRRRTSALKDVAGMLRSLQYASRFALNERAEHGSAQLEGCARAWEDRNRAAFVKGYYDCKGIDELLPGRPDDREAVRAALEVDKALYEVSYEAAYRPGWRAIPLSALERMFSQPVDKLLAAPEAPAEADDVQPERADDLLGS
jgi:maltokinase